MYILKKSFPPPIAFLLLENNLLSLEVIYKLFLYGSLLNWKKNDFSGKINNFSGKIIDFSGKINDFSGKINDFREKDYFSGKIK